MRKFSFVFIAIVLLLTACTRVPASSKPAATAGSASTSAAYPAAEKTPQSGYPPAEQTPQQGQQGYPVPTTAGPKPAATDTDNGDHFVYPKQTAFSAIKVAEERAKKWKPGAKLLQIPRLRQMETNLGIPMGPSGWFFSFKDPTDGSAVEFYVEVIDNVAVGTNEVQFLYGGVKEPYILVPIDLSKKLLDSDAVYDIFMKNGADAYLKGRGKVELDFQLVQIEGRGNPVWSVFDTKDGNLPPLINVDAVTGKIVEDPFGFLNK
jgi:hypothetical protein